jgi:hypothetical protein
MPDYPWFIWLMLLVIPASLANMHWERNLEKIPDFYRKSPISMAVIRQGYGLTTLIFGILFALLLLTDYLAEVMDRKGLLVLREMSIWLLVGWSLVSLCVFFFSRPRFLIPKDLRPETLRGRLRNRAEKRRR